MGRKQVALAALIFLSPVASWAGTSVVQPAPTLGELGLIGLGVTLVGVGVRYLRKR